MRRSDQSPLTRPISLIGMSGAGKSSLGSALAQMLDATFIDTDHLIVERAGRPLPDLVAELGTKAFRRYESETVRTINPPPNSIIATGGSVVYEPDAMAHLQAISTIVWLQVSVETIRKRIGDGRGRGIVLRQGQDLGALMTERDPLYERYADIRINCDETSPEDLRQRILRAVDAHP
jgi:shikimate kinase